IDNLMRPASDANASVQKTKDYFLSLDMAYEMAMEEEGELGRQVGDYLRDCDTPQHAYIAIQDRPFVRRAVGQAMRATTAIPLPIEAQVKQADLDQYQALGKATQPMAPDEDLLVLPIHEVSKTIETLSLYRDKVTELHGLSVWMEQHISNLHAYINHQFMEG
ncbi:antA/AntB antirepressor family protein, partial [Marinomonas transparens]